MSLVNLILQAYGLQPYQIAAADQYRGDLFQISARVPEGATREDLNRMLQVLLEERFKLVYRIEKKEGQVFDLIVGRNGHKLVSSEAPPPTPPGAAPGPPIVPGRFERDRDGVPIMPRGAVGTMMTMRSDGLIVSRSNGTTMAALARRVANEIGRPVNDATGLAGKYDIALTYLSERSRAQMASLRAANGQPEAGDAADPAPTIFTALQEQLGLKLEPRKGMIETFVIDRVERTPTEN
jgi:uncharacterized protein (TIGR03435 family)